MSNLYPGTVWYYHSLAQSTGVLRILRSYLHVVYCKLKLPAAVRLLCENKNCCKNQSINPKRVLEGVPPQANLVLAQHSVPLPPLSDEGAAQIRERGEEIARVQRSTVRGVQRHRAGWGPECDAVPIGLDLWRAGCGV